MENKPPAEPAEDDTDALEAEPAENQTTDTPTIDASKDASQNVEPQPDPTLPKVSLWRRLVSHLNIYLLLFIFLLVIGGTIVGASYLDSKHTSTTANLGSKSLSATTLAQLANSDATVGGSGQLLNVESSAVFASKVLIRQDLDVAGNLQIGGVLSLNNLAVSGTTQLGQAQINKDLAVAGNTSLQGAVTIAKSLQVSGGGTFSGPVSAPQLTTSTLQLNGDLSLTHHIIAGGATPNRSNGTALGSGGTSSVSGSDTAGSITINTGGSPAAGCFVTVNFSVKYNNTPHVLVTPVGSAAAGLSYYINRTTTGFSLCDAAAPTAGSSFGFDYFVID